jgi:hypothetical protein
MGGLSWLKKRGPFRIDTRALGDWKVVEVRGRFMGSGPEERFHRQVNDVLKSGARRVVVDLSQSLLGDDTVAGAAAEAYHKARVAGTDLRFVVLPGKAGGYYHMAGLEMTIPTFGTIQDAIA